MADEKPSEEKVRHTISLSHKQAGISAATIMALTAALTGPLSKIFQTKAEAAVQMEQIVELKALIGASKIEIIDKIDGTIKSIVKDLDRHETRIVNLEFLQMKKGR